SIFLWTFCSGFPLPMSTTVVVDFTNFLFSGTEIKGRVYVTHDLILIKMAELFNVLPQYITDNQNVIIACQLFLLNNIYSETFTYEQLFVHTLRSAVKINCRRDNLSVDRFRFFVTPLHKKRKELIKLASKHDIDFIT